MTSKPPEIPLKTRWLLYAGAWGVAFLARTVILPLREHRFPDPVWILTLVIFVPVFPAGLVAWFNLPNPIEQIGPIAVLWLAYLVHGVFTLRSRTRARFYGLLSILAIVLAFNVVGCERIHRKSGKFGYAEPPSAAYSGLLVHCDARPLEPTRPADADPLR